FHMDNDRHGKISMTTRFWLLTGLVLTLAYPALAQEEAGVAPVETAMAAPATSHDGDTENWELCPEPSDALGNVPSRLDELQADIDRYTLCLNRAELLLKLEDLRTQNNAGAGANAGMMLPGSLTPAPLTEQQAGELLGEIPAATSAASVTPALPLEYGIRNISGVG